MQFNNDKYITINNRINNLLNYSSSPSLTKIYPSINENLNNVLHYKLFIDNYININNSMNKYCDVVYKLINSDIEDDEKVYILKKLLRKMLKKQTGGVNSVISGDQTTPRRVAPLPQNPPKPPTISPIVIDKSLTSNLPKPPTISPIVIDKSLTSNTSNTLQPTSSTTLLSDPSKVINKDPTSNTLQSVQPASSTPTPTVIDNSLISNTSNNISNTLQPTSSTTLLSDPSTFIDLKNNTNTNLEINSVKKLEEIIVEKLSGIGEEEKIKEQNLKIIEIKINNIKERMKKVIEIHIFNLMTRFQNIINELENKSSQKQNKNTQEKIDYNSIYKELIKKIDESRNKHNSDDLYKYINELDRYVGQLENSINSTKNSLQNSKLTGGSLKNFKEEEEKENKIKLENIHKLEKLNYVNNFSTLFNIKSDDLSSEIYSQIVTIIHLLNYIPDLITKYNLFIQFFKDIKIEEIWDNYFSYKITSYYQDIKINKIFIFKNIEEGIKNNKVISNEITFAINENNNNDIINQLDMTIVFFNIIINIYNSILISLKVFTTGNIDIESNNKLYIAFNSFKKSFILTEFNYFDSIYTDINKINSYKDKYITEAININSLELPTNQEINTFIQFYYSYIEQINNGNIETPMDNINKIQINKGEDSVNIVEELYNKIDNMSGNKKSTKDNNQVEIDNNIDSISAMVKVIDANTKPKQGGGAMTANIEQIKPRIDFANKQLMECLRELKPFFDNVKKIKKILNKVSSKKINDFEETKSLHKMNNILDTQIKQGINSYIKVIPMISFTIEFPPEIYEKDSCKYGFSYDSKTELYTKKLISTENCKPDELIEPTEISAPTHAAFFKATNNNGTKKLIDDPIIGLKKILDSNNLNDNVINKVINMMFALGASGTGKTTRYFGNSLAPNPDDHIGIVTSIINEARQKANTQVELAYFVSYGRYESAKLNEFLLFFKIDKPQDSEGIFPYFMPKTTNEINIDTYSNFYTKLVSKKLKSINYSLIKSYIEDGKVLPNLNESQNNNFYTFRELLELNSSDIWKTLTENDQLDQIFEDLLTRQKKAHTVLPTKNNSESSRGHTCVLIKITENGITKYFPLFDMAGTENTDKMKEFLTKGRKENNVARLVSLFSEYSQNNKLMNGEKQINSLKDLFDILKFENYVNNGILVGGGPTKLDVKNIKQKELDENKGTNELLNKIINEGFYINHTIGMLIFAAQAVGKSLNSTVKDGVDNFDLIETPLFEGFKEFTSLINNSNSDKTKILYNGYTFEDILNNSCIWVQILFSFLYWNIVTEKGKNEIMLSDKIDYDDYKIEIIHSNSNPTIYSNNGYELNLNQIKTLDSKLIAKLEEINLDLENGKYILEFSTNSIFYKISTEGDITQLTKEIESLNKNIVSSQSTSTSIPKHIETYRDYISKTNNNTTNIDANLYLLTGLYKIDSITGKLSSDKILIDTDKIKLSETNGYISHLEPLEKRLADVIAEYKSKTFNSGMTSTSLPNMDIIDKKYPIKVEEYDNTFGKIIDSATLSKYKAMLLKIKYKYRINTATGAVFKTKTELESENKLINDKINIELEKYKIENEKLIKTQEATNKELQKKIKELEEKNLKLQNMKQVYNKEDIKQILQLLKITSVKLEASEIMINGTLKLKDILDKIKQILKLKLLLKPNLVEQNMIKRIKDSILDATKMVLMHLVTGQAIKHPMVNETIGLTKIFWNSTQNI